MEYNKFHEEVESSASDCGESVFESSLSISEQFKQAAIQQFKLSNLMRDLNLSKEQKFWHRDSKTKTSLEPELQQHSTVREKKNYFRSVVKNLFTEKTSKGFY